MANTKSAIKNTRKNETNRTRNRRAKSRLKTLAKRVAQAEGGDDAEATKSAAREYISALDKAANKGIIHKNAVARRKAGSARLLAS